MCVCVSVLLQDIPSPTYPLDPLSTMLLRRSRSPSPPLPLLLLLFSLVSRAFIRLTASDEFMDAALGGA